MGLKYCLTELKQSVKLLHKIDVKLVERERRERQKRHALYEQGKEYTGTGSMIDEHRVTFNQHIADLALVTNEVQKYCMIRNGIPVTGLLDEYSPHEDDESDSESESDGDGDGDDDGDDADADADVSGEIDTIAESIYGSGPHWTLSKLRCNEDTIVRTFMAKTAWQTSLIPIMREEAAAKKRKTPVTNAEIFATWCAIGKTSFTAFEIAVHRQVRNVSEQTWKMAVKMGVIEANGKTKVRKTRVSSRTPTTPTPTPTSVNSPRLSMGGKHWPGSLSGKRLPASRVV